jgi:hypothetical protein
VLWAGWQLYLRLFARSVTLAALVFAVVYLPGLLALPLLLTGLGSFGVAALLGAVALSVLLYVFGELLVQGALTEAVREVHAQREASSTAQLLGTARRRLGALVGATILVSLLAFGAVVAGIIVIGAVAQVVGPLAILLVLAGVCLFVVLLTRCALVVPAVVVENAPPRLALGRSMELVRGSGWKVFWTLSLAGIAIFVATLFVQFVLGMLLGPWLAAFAAAVLTAPYFSFVVAAMYFALAEPNAPIVPDEDAATWQSIWVDKTL